MADGLRDVSDDPMSVVSFPSHQSHLQGHLLDLLPVERRTHIAAEDANRDARGLDHIQPNPGVEARCQSRVMVVEMLVGGL